MLGRTARPRGNDAEASASQPLLNDSQEDLHEGSSRVIFSAGGDDEDEDDYYEASALDPAGSPPAKSGHSVRFNEDVQVIAPPMRSMTESRETEYELDSDDLDDAAIRQLEAEQDRPRSARRDRDQSMPLLVGLFDSASARRSMDGSLRLEQRGELGGELRDENIDLEELAAKRTAGGGMFDSVANMANSILGAGNARV
ncbi:hypothetical protein PHLGIDRAFT_184036 [Phlebiopsis gigantea 11061_1 CR5-6]|uniref:Uncharacterized protein n=1 Tax=Phlebiopsis gigantea (strain 11061_1 CR5-6) TaxID=745531 RepID=A0A0C3SES9_PHLG1|nr:hypothetical protein PHLGIDRAFT_184036 [Phlebiopsis gigantea 11061_1 CR5-6]